MFAAVGYWYGAEPIATMNPEHNVVAVTNATADHTALVWLSLDYVADHHNGCRLCIGCTAMFISPRVLFVRSGSHAALVSFWPNVTASSMSPLFSAVIRSDHAAVLKYEYGDVWAPPGFGPLTNASHIAMAMNDIESQHMLLCRGYYGWTAWACPWQTTQQRRLARIWKPGVNAATLATAYARDYPDAAHYVARWLVNQQIGQATPAQVKEIALAARWGTGSSIARLERASLSSDAALKYRRGRGGRHTSAIATTLLVGLRCTHLLPPELWVEIVSFLT